MRFTATHALMTTAMAFCLLVPGNAAAAQPRGGPASLPTDAGRERARDELAEAMDAVRWRVDNRPKRSCSLHVPWDAQLADLSAQVRRVVDEPDADDEQRLRAMASIQHLDGLFTWVEVLSGQMCRRRQALDRMQEQRDRDHQAAVISLASVMEQIHRKGCPAVINDRVALAALFHAHRPAGEVPRRLVREARPTVRGALRRIRLAEMSDEWCGAPERLGELAEYAIDGVSILPDPIRDHENAYEARRRLLQREVDAYAAALLRPDVE